MKGRAIPMVSASFRYHLIPFSFFTVQQVKKGYSCHVTCMRDTLQHLGTVRTSSIWLVCHLNASKIQVTYQGSSCSLAECLYKYL